MNPEIKQKWIDALTSGEYEQGAGVLREGNKYCCLGVLCDLYIKETNPEKDWEPVPIPVQGDPCYSFLGATALPPLEVIHWAGLEQQDVSFGGYYLITLNDNPTSFKDIAKHIATTKEP